MANFKGTSGDDHITGTAGDDVIRLGQGGEDTANGGSGGHDLFIMDDALDAGDRITGSKDGGAVSLDGDYNLVFAATTIKNIDMIELAAGHNYNLTLNDANIADGQTLAVEADGLGTGDTLIFNGSAETSAAMQIFGGQGNDTITGGGGDDNIQDLVGANTIHGGGGNDSIDSFGDGGKVVLDGDDGNDILFGGSGKGFLNGGAGNDNITSFSNKDQIDGGMGLDTAEINRVNLTQNLNIDLSNSAHAVSFGGGSVVHVETFQFFSGLGNDRITLGAGDDTLGGGGGDNTLNGGAGNDTIYASDPSLQGTGNNTVFGGDGNDTLSGDNGSNTLNGGAGNDSISSVGHDVIIGGGGTDFANINLSGMSAGLVFDGSDSAKTATIAGEGTTVTGVESFFFEAGSGNDKITLGAGDDTIFSGAGNSTLTGGGGNDSLNAGDIFGDFSSGTGILSGESGNDILTGGAGHNTLSGGTGDDAIVSNGIDAIDGGAGENSAVIARSSLTADLIFDGSDPTHVAKIFGDGGSTVTGIEIYTFRAGAGNDTITAGAQDDTLYGGDGNNTLSGGDGNDLLVNGYNTTFAISGGNSTLAGGDGDDRLFGGTGHDVLNGGEGDDTISSIGLDKINGGSGDDLAAINRSFLTAALTFNGSDSAHAATITGDGTIVIGVETYTFTGGAGNDTITLGAGNDTLAGGAGHNTLNGGGGDDSIVSIGQDTINGGAGNDVATVDRSASTVDLTFDGTDSLHIAKITGDGTTVISVESYHFTGGSGDDNITLGAGDDTLSGGGGAFGGGGDNTLSGGAGNDTITSFGVDKIDGGTGDDTVVIDLGFLATQGLTFDYTSRSSVTTVQGWGTTVVNTANIHFTGSQFDDDLVAGAGDDVLNGFSGNDILNGGAGDDTLTSGSGDDKFIGGAGNDTVQFTALNEAVTASLVTGTASSVSITNPNNETIGIGLDTLSSVENLSGSVEGDTFIGNGADNRLDGGQGGNDHLLGGGGNDVLVSLQFVGEGDASLDGGAGNDTAIIAELATSANTSFDFTSSTAITEFVGGQISVINVENFEITGGYGVDTYTTGDGNDILSGQSSDDVLSGGGGDDILTGNGNINDQGGTDGDTLVGGTGNDILEGDQDADILNGGPGHDTFRYLAVSDSMSSHYDTIIGFDPTQDHFRLPTAVVAVNHTVSNGTLDADTFDTDLARAIGSAQLGVHKAVLFEPTAGSLAHDVFLIIDANGVSGYQAGEDYVIRLQSGVNLGSLTAADFTTS